MEYLAETPQSSRANLLIVALDILKVEMYRAKD